MFKTLRLKTKSSNYPIKIGYGVFKKFINDLSKFKCKKYIIVDLNVYKNFKLYFKNIELF